MRGGTRRHYAVLDTSVLINFLRVNRLDLLARHPCYKFYITDHVRAEITDHYPDQREKLDQAIASGNLQELRVTDHEEIQAFGQLSASKRLGAGECSAISVAAIRRFVLAIDDKRAQKEAKAFSPELVLIDTEHLLLSLIREGVIDVADADGIKLELERKDRFKMNFGSFADRLRPPQ